MYLRVLCLGEAYHTSTYPLLSVQDWRRGLYVGERAGTDSWLVEWLWRGWGEKRRKKGKKEKKEKKRKEKRKRKKKRKKK